MFFLSLQRLAYETGERFQLHGRMPVILDSKADLKLWLSPAPWGPKLDNLLKPYSNKLECYKVPPEVGDVHKESPVGDCFHPCQSERICLVASG